MVESNKPVLLPPFMQKELSSSYGANYHPLTDKGSINVANAKSTQSSCVSVQSAGSLIIPSKAFSCNQFRPTLTSVTDITGTLANSSNTSLPTIVTSKLANTAGFAPLGPEACLPPISHAETNDALLHRKYYSQYNCAASPKSSSNSLSSELIDLDGIKNLNPTLSKDTTKVQSLVAPRRDYSIDLTCASDDAKELSHNESSDTKIKAIRKEDDASCYSPGQFGKMCVRQNTDNIVKVSMSLSDCSRKSLLDRIRELGSSYVKSTNYRCSLCQDQVPSFWAAHLLHIAHYHSQDCLDSVIDSNIRLPFCCQYCGECFWLRSDLAVHAPVFCQYCPAASQPLCSNTFYLHMLINHLVSQ
ncbi:unnamed protein product [Protopolystoma xenopodis]|uniref:C2H2-type domain-containing protein n=1 Tax=Protopolystoma xenopodis TaxID=117903 RepID=A0A448WRH9_9PLAT|nr:unnamed protein product [Protopolystoma xenopodis]